MKRRVVWLVWLAVFACSSVAWAEDGSPDAAVNAATRQAVVASLGKTMKSRYVFPDVADKVAAALSLRLKQGAYKGDTTATAFAKVLTADLRKAGNDRHLRVDYVPGFKPEPHDDAPPTAAQLADVRKFIGGIGYGVAEVERLPGNVGYLDLRMFPRAPFVSRAYASVMQLLSGSDALIIDLRQNGGGDPAAVSNFMSYFFIQGDRRHINDMYWRKGHRTQQFWTMPVAGPRYTKPVYVLISARTFSGGEECAYDFQTQKRATLVGHTTGGGANPGAVMALGHGFAAFVPVGRAINPITKTNWEHVGVKPDVAVPAAQAMNTAYASILKTLIKSAKDPGRKHGLEQVLARVRKGEPPEQPDYSPLAF